MDIHFAFDIRSRFLILDLCTSRLHYGSPEGNLTDQIRDQFERVAACWEQTLHQNSDKRQQARDICAWQSDHKVLVSKNKAD